MAIIEVGDLIELGDVRFKFVGAGQVFVAGPGESQQLTAIRDRDAAASGRGSWGVVPSMFLGVLVAFAAVGSFWWFQLRQREAPLLTTTGAPLGARSEPRAALPRRGQGRPARRRTARRRTGASSPRSRRGSPLRESPDFLAIEATWADNVLGQAGQEPDPARQHELLRRVADAPTVDAERRRIAAQRAQALAAPAPGSVAPVSHPPEVTAPATAHATATPPAPTTTTKPERPRGGSSASSTAAAPAPTPRPTAASPNQDADKARNLMATGDNAGARRLLESKVMAGKGSAEEVFLLRQICKSPVDMACLDAIKQRYPH